MPLKPIVSSATPRFVPTTWQRGPMFGALRPDATLGEVVKHAEDVFTSSTELKEKSIPYSLTTLIDSISDDALAAFKTCREDDKPRLLADALQPEFERLAKRARLGEDIHFIMPNGEEDISDSDNGNKLNENITNLLRKRGVNIDNLYIMAALLRLREEFSDVFRQVRKIGSSFTKKKIMTGLSAKDVEWEVLKDMALATKGKSFPSIDTFLRKYYPNEPTRNQYDLSKDFYKRLIDKKAIIPTDYAAWENNKKEFKKASWKDVSFQKTGNSQDLTVSPIVKILKMPDGTSSIRSIPLTEALLPQLLEVARACQRIQRETGKEGPIRMGALAREMGLQEKILNKAIREAPEGINKLFVTKIPIGTFVNSEPHLTDEMIEQLLAPNGAAKREAWGEADPKIIVGYVMHAGAKKDKPVAFA